MRLLVQRVKNAAVTVDGKVVGQIQMGLLGLVGISDDDTEQDADYIARKLLTMRLWEDEKNTGWRNDVKQIQGGVLLVSQFTLYGRLNKGNKPDFHKAMPPEPARAAWDAFVEKVRHAYVAERVQTGVFGAMMEVELVNDGPVTLILESEDARHSFKQAKAAKQSQNQPRRQQQQQQQQQQQPAASAEPQPNPEGPHPPEAVAKQ